MKGLRGGVQDVALKMLIGETHYHVNSFRQVGPAAKSPHMLLCYSLAARQVLRCTWSAIELTRVCATMQLTHAVAGMQHILRLCFNKLLLGYRRLTF